MSARKLVACLHVAQDAARDQPGYLYEGNGLPIGRIQHHRVALVFQRSLVQIGIDELAGKILHTLNLAIHRTAVGMHVEHVHKHTDQNRFALTIRILLAFDLDDTSIAGRQHCTSLLRYLTCRIAKELQHEQRDDPSQK